MASFKELVNSEKPVLIDFYADWCQPCKMLTPIIQDVAKQVNGKARVVKIDVDKNQELAQKLQIRGVPTLMIFKEGEMKWRQSGVLQAAQIIAQLGQYI